MRYILCLIIGLQSILITAQWSDNFNDGNFTDNPEWFGDVSDFIVNTDGQLQLNSSEAKTSSLFSNVNFPDSVRWSGYALYDFAPSANNNGAIYLALDVPDLAMANGYIMRFGENGSDDAINFIRLDSGVESVLAVGVLGQLGGDPAEFSFRVTRDADNNWIVGMSYFGGPFSQELSVFDNTYAMSTMTYFGIESKVTSSNTSKVFFDDLLIEEDLPDMTPPVLSEVRVIFPTVIGLTFDEAMDENSIRDINNYVVNPGNIMPDLVVFSTDNPGYANLSFEPALPFSTELTLTVTGVTDIAGNAMSSVDFPFLIPEEPIAGDIKLSEILFDPYQEMEDFVEIVNVSDKVLSIANVYIENDTKPESEEALATDLLLLPGQYLAIMDDSTGMYDRYQYPDTANFLLRKIPTFNNADGNLTVGVFVNGVKTPFESFDYEEDYHLSLIDDTEGVSLERISYSIDAAEVDNWYSSSEANNFATPGYRNSNTLDFGPAQDEFVYLGNTTFSPNGDNQDDQLEILFDLDKPGYLGTVQIFDTRGQLKRTLSNNRLLATQDFILWDGTLEDGSIGNIGIYILFVKVFHSDGEVKTKKVVSVLADYLD